MADEQVDSSYSKKQILNDKDNSMLVIAQQLQKENFTIGQRRRMAPLNDYPNKKHLLHKTLANDYVEVAIVVFSPRIPF